MLPTQTIYLLRKSINNIIRQLRIPVPHDGNILHHTEQEGRHKGYIPSKKISDLKKVINYTGIFTMEEYNRKLRAHKLFLGDKKLQFNIPP